MIFNDRSEAGKKLAEKLQNYKGNPNVVVLGLPRGGIVPAFEIAKELNVNLDILISRKIGHPLSDEMAIGAITEYSNIYLKKENLPKLGVSNLDADIMTKKAKDETNIRKQIYRTEFKSISLKNKIVIIIDDGIATGATMIAAIEAAKKEGAKKIIVGIPVIPKDTIDKIESRVDELIYLESPTTFWGVSQVYRQFPQLTHSEVLHYLKKQKTS